MRKLSAGLICIACAALVPWSLFAQNAPPPRPEIDAGSLQALEEAVRQFTRLYALAEQNAPEPLDPSTALYQGAIPGMLQPLDPHSVFFDPGQFRQLQEMQHSIQRGFGSIVSVLPGRVLVLQTMPGSPAERSGLGPGDEILAVNGVALYPLSFDQLVSLLTYSRQQKAELLVRKGGAGNLVELTLTPAELQSPSVERVFRLDTDFGYIRLASFDADSAAKLREAIQRLGGDNLRGLILDLRGNPGGMLQSAIETAGLFLEPGTLLFTARGRAEGSRPVFVENSAKPYHFPLAVLIGERTASAAEILAGALQDHKRAVIIGQRSFGKGLVQQVYPLSNETGLALTTAFYYTPSGRSIQRPLRQGQLDAAQIARLSPAHQEAVQGGIQPDIAAGQEFPSRLGEYLEATGLVTVFVTEYLKKSPSVTEDFQVTPELLDEFQVFLSGRNVRPSLAEWSATRTWLESRLKQEVFNLALGVEKGDEVEVRRDPAVLQALRQFDQR